MILCIEVKFLRMFSRNFVRIVLFKLFMLLIIIIIKLSIKKFMFM